MDLINQFIENYKKKMNFYETAGRLAAKQLKVPFRQQESVPWSPSVQKLRDGSKARSSPAMPDGKSLIKI